MNTTTGPATTRDDSTQWITVHLSVESTSDALTTTVLGRLLDEVAGYGCRRYALVDGIRLDFDHLPAVRPGLSAARYNFDSASTYGEVARFDDAVHVTATGLIPTTDPYAADRAAEAAYGAMSALTPSLSVSVIEVTDATDWSMLPDGTDA